MTAGGATTVTNWVLAKGDFFGTHLFQIWVAGPCAVPVRTGRHPNLVESEVVWLGCVCVYQLAYASVITSSKVQTSFQWPLLQEHRLALPCPGCPDNTAHCDV